MLPHRLLETVHHNLTASRAEYWSVTASRISHESIQWWSLAFYCLERYLPSTLFPPHWKTGPRVEARYVPATAVCPAGFIGCGRKIIRWATTCASDAGDGAFLFVCPPRTTCTTAPTCVVKWWDARLLIIFNARSCRGGLPAAQPWRSEKSSQLQSNMCMHLWHFVTFRDSFHHFSNPCVWWWATDVGQSKHVDVFFLRGSRNFIKNPSEERPRFVHTILAWKVLGRSLGRMRGWWEHRKFDQQLWLRISLAVSSWKDWLFVYHF